MPSHTFSAQVPSSRATLARVRTALKAASDDTSATYERLITDVDAELAVLAPRRAALNRDWAAAILDATTESLDAHEAQLREADFDQKRLEAAREELERRLELARANELEQRITALIRQASDVCAGSRKLVSAVDAAAVKLVQAIRDYQAATQEYNSADREIERLAPGRSREIDSSKLHPKFGMELGYTGGAGAFKITHLTDDVVLWPRI